MAEITNKVKGRIKQAAGAITGNRKLQNEGERDEAKGRVEGVVADVKHAAKVVADDAKEVAAKILKK
jgi:uncharacterized protein YjbJ (UPF0337 family)